MQCSLRLHACMLPDLSDHSMIDVELDLRCRSTHYDITFHTCCSWRTFDYDAFERDLCCSALVLSPADDVSQLVADYEALLDIYAPYRRVRQSTRLSQAVSCGMMLSAVQPDTPHASLSVATAVVHRPNRLMHGKASSRINVISSTAKLKITGLVHLPNIVIIHIS